MKRTFKQWLWTALLVQIIVGCSSQEGEQVPDASISDATTSPDTATTVTDAPADTASTTPLPDTHSNTSTDIPTDTPSDTEPDTPDAPDTSNPSDTSDPPDISDIPDIPVQPITACDPAPSGGSQTVAAPVLIATLSDRWHEAWQGSPAVVDLDGDGTPEILAPRDELLLGWHLDGTVVFRATNPTGRIWASPVVADLRPDIPGLEVAAASRANLYVWDADGNLLSGFPVTARDELRSLAVGDIDGDADLELVVAVASSVGANLDNITAFHHNGSVVAGFPPITTGAAGCTDNRCYLAGCYDQNLALGNVDDDPALEIFVTQDNAYLGLYNGDGSVFDADPTFPSLKFLGVRGLHDLALARQGYADDEDTALQAHYTNSAPAIADIDGDGQNELIVLASVQNASQVDRFKGVALWVLRPDGTRHSDWIDPLHYPDYLAGLWDFDGTNIVGATNQVSVADIDASHPGLEMVFAGFDGRIHAASADRQSLWDFTYTTSDQVLTGGVVIADLSGDGQPEVIFNTYSTQDGAGELIILDATGNLLHRVALPGRGAMPVPTVAKVDATRTAIIVSLKDGEDRVQQVLVYGVASASDNCLLWPTGRGNWLRNGYVP